MERGEIKFNCPTVSMKITNEYYINSVEKLYLDIFILITRVIKYIILFITDRGG